MTPECCKKKLIKNFCWNISKKPPVKSMRRWKINIQMEFCGYTVSSEEEPRPGQVECWALVIMMMNQVLWSGKFLQPNSYHPLKNDLLQTSYYFNSENNCHNNLFLTTVLLFWVSMTHPYPCVPMWNAIFNTGHWCLLIANIHHTGISQTSSKRSSYMILQYSIVKVWYKTVVKEY
jgi:hypothetical protein